MSKQSSALTRESQLHQRRVEGLSQLAGRIRHQVRAVPELRFFLDESQAHAERIETLLGQIRDERASRLEASGNASGETAGEGEGPDAATPDAAMLDVSSEDGQPDEATGSSNATRDES